MLDKFIFVNLLYFLIINIANYIPIEVLNLSYYLLITTNIFDTDTLLVLSISIPKYVYLKNLKILEGFNEIENSKSESININLLRRKITNNRKLSSIFFACFLILTLIQPILLIFEFNRSDIYSSNIIRSIEADFEKSKKNIEDKILIHKSKLEGTKEITRLEDDIKNLLNNKNNRIKNFLTQNNKLKFNNSKIIIRNFLLGALWVLVFYKLSKL